MKDFEKAIELDKGFAPGYGALGLLRALAPEPPIRNPGQALRLAEKASSLTGGTSPDMLEILAEVQHALDRPDDALRTLQQAIAMDPSNKDYQELLRKWTGHGAAVPSQVDPGKTQMFPNLW